ncbi:class II myosin [Malassezia psittaci]|uniref:Class II myosin n=1 Tax=Malassezia psittaci TaxID=1821823 RepID=A0AAF0F961_9BASI|nr:class II myosin [Malassezia psittaci]
MAAYVVSEKDGESTVCLNTGQVLTVPTSTLSEMNPSKFEKVADIADLTFLNEASVVHNLRQRYFSDLIYTYSGLFLVAVNPYHTLPIYTEAIVEQYRGMRREANPPHIFAVADEAIQNMIHAQANQSLLITGESGAGKTENTKRVIQYLTAVALDADADPEADVQLHRRMSHEPLGLLERQILQANPILEAFGNAQTVRNNNSSRFGKFIKIEFAAHGAIAGGNIEWYLLEKSRVHSRAANERNFHIFYQLLRSRNKTLLDKFCLKNHPDQYNFLKHSRKDVEGVDDSHEWLQLRAALQTMGFREEEEEDLFRVVAGILQLGNLDLAEDRSEQARITNLDQLAVVGEVLGVEASKLQNALVRPTVRAGREMVTQARNKKQVVDEIAALCKTMYEKTFGWLVDRINHVLDRPTSKSRFIGVLDIAGFEIFETNSFEQLCINYTNEKLQQFFNYHMFMLEQEEYAREHISWDYVNFGLDLQPTIDLIESNSPIGILSCLDEECIMPKASDHTFTEKLKATWAPSQKEQADSKLIPSRQAKKFVVKHYAANVEYNTEQWLDKNRDPLNENVARVLASSQEPFLASLFAEFESPTDSHTSTPRGRRGAFRTVGQRHKEQLASLMAQLDATEPHFVRCIVPNSEKKPGKLELPLVLDQLRCNGVLEGIRIARLGYPNRLLFSEFSSRYAILTPEALESSGMDARVMSQRIAQALELNQNEYKIGITKIFFKAGVLAEMEEHRDACLNALFTRFHASARRAMSMRRLQKRLRRAAATDLIQNHAIAYRSLEAWPWWQLYHRLLPLLAASQDDEERKRRELELAIAKERAVRDEQERAALATLEAQLLAEKERGATAAHDAITAANQNAALQKEVDAINEQLLLKTEEWQAQSDRLSELQSLCDAYQQENTQLQHRIDQFAQRESEFQAEFQSLTSELDSVLSERDDFAKERDQIAKQITQLREDLATARTNLREHSDAAETHVRDLAARHEAELQGVQSQLESAQSQLQAKQREFNEKHVESDKLQQELEQVKTDWQQINDHHSELSQHAAKQQQRAEELSLAKDQATARLGDLERENAKLKSEVASLEASIASLRTSKDTGSARIQQLTDSNQAAQQEIARLQRELKEELSNKQTLEAKAARLEEREAATASELKEKHTELVKAQQAIHTAELESKRLYSAQNKTIVEHVHVLEEAKKYTDRQLSEVQGELQELTNYTKSLERARSRMQQENEQLTRLANVPPAPEKDHTAIQERDEARAALRNAKQAADLTLRQTRAEYEIRIKQLENEIRASQRVKSDSNTEQVMHELSSERKMSSAARKVLEELRLENERLEKDLAAKANALRTK